MHDDNVILVVDDDPAMLAGTARLLRKGGYTVVTAPSGQEGLQAAREHMPTLILLDVVLPDIDGIEVCRRLKADEKTARLFVCILSGLRRSSTEQSIGLENGADDYIVRPIENRELLARVNAMLRLVHTEKELEIHRNRLEQLVEERTARLEAEIARHRETGEALRKSEEHYRTLFENVSDAVYVHRILPNGEPGPFEQVNAAAQAMLGYSAEEFSTMSPWELDDPETTARVIPGAMERLERDGKARFEAIQVARDGRKLIVEVNSVLADIQGQTYIVSACRDITENKRAESVIEQNEENLRQMTDAMQETLSVIALDGTFLYANQKTNQNLSHGKPGGVIGKNLAELLPKAQAESLIERYRAVYQAGEPFHQETEVALPKGDTWFFNTLKPIEYGNPPAPAVLSVSLDITARKQAEVALRESRQKFHSMVDNIGIGVALISPGMEILELNRQMREWFPDIEPGRRPHCYGAFNDPPRSRVCDWCPTVKTFEDGLVHESVSATPRGEKTVNFRIVSSPVLDDRGQVTAAIEMVEDITEQRKFESHLRKVQKMESIGNLAGGIAHDFNNILFPIIGMAELLLEDLPPGSPEHENAAEIFNAGRRGSDLVKQILAFSRQSEHKMIPTRVQHILKEVLKLSRSTIPSSIEIVQDIQPDCGLVMADPTQIHQVAMNIITNAYHAVEADGGAITVRLSETKLEAADLHGISLDPGRYAVLSFADTGQGMPANHLERIFDPYFTTKALGKGTGLGLAVVHGIVKEHKGDIGVSSEVGKGSTFKVYLPLMKPSAIDEPFNIAEACPLGMERVLLVDDEAPIARLEKQVLERLGYGVTVRTSSSDAFEAFKANPSNFDLVISDMAMPNMTGDLLARELKKIRPDIPIIICTGFSERINADKADALGIDGFLMKPIVRSELAKTVRKVLEGAKVK
jgi:PAS domain S-box-containing protein